MKFKRFLSLLLALTLVLSYVPVGAFATETGDDTPIVSEETPNETPSETPSETPDGDAEIEQIADEPTVKTVATEAELAAALAEGGDIKLETQKMGDMYMPLNVTSILTVPADKTVNLDLNGITVVLNDKYLVNNGTLTVTNGTIAASTFNDETNGAPLYNFGTLVVDANVSGVCAAIRTEAGKVTINGGTISATENTGKTAQFLRVKGGEVVINGGEFVGCNSTNPSDGCGLINATAGSTVIYGGTFSDFSAQTLKTKADYVTIYGGTFKPTHMDNIPLTTLMGPVLATGYEISEEGVVSKTPITGTITPAYTSSTGFWGEGGGNALTSYVVTLYEGDAVIATATLNNVGGIIDGSVYVTWNIPFAGSNDEYWTVVWANGYPNADMAPTKVTLTLDGNVVAENVHQWNAPDDLNKIVAAASQDGKFIGYYASLSEAVAAGNEVDILTAGTYAVPTGKNCTITGAVEGVVFDNIGNCGMGGVSVTFNNVTFDYYPNTNYTGLQHSGNMVYNNCPFNGQVFLYGQSETFNNCIFNQNSADAYNVWTYGAKEVAFNECTFNSAGKSVLIYSEQSDLVNNVTVTESTFNATAAVDGKAAIEMDSSLTSGINLTVDAATTATGFGSGNVSGNSLWNNKKGNETAANNDITVVVNNETVLKPIVLGLSGEGTAASPYLINNLEELVWFQNHVNSGNNYQGKVVKLNADIDLGGMEWTPISTFNGVFDGGNHTISNLVISGNNSNAGFFGQTNNGEIKNLTIHNAKVSGYLNVGVVAGTPYTSKYTNIKVTGHVEVNGYAYVGGVGGKNAYANWTDITVDVDSTSYVKAESEGYRTYVGGVIGFNGEGGHTFKNISSNIAVIGSTADIGGIFGIAHYGNKFENITFTGSVTAPEDAIQVGGIAGVWHNQKGTSVTFDNVTSTGSVTVGTETTTGSIVGDAYHASNDSVENSGSLVIDGSEAWLKVVSIGETKYSSLAAAIEEVEENGTITLLVDLEFNKYNYMLSSGSWYEGLYYTGDKSFTLDLNGKTVTCTADVNDYMFNIKNMGEKANEITIKNGTITGGTSVWSVLCVGSSAENQATTVNLENVTINAGTQPNWGDLAVKVRGASVVNVKSGTKIVGQSGTTYVVAAEGDAVLNVYEGAEITACAANAPAVSGDSTVNIYGGTITATNGAFAVYTYSTGDPVVNISGGTINGDVYAHADVTSDANAIATVNISGGTINGKLVESYYGTPTTVCSEISVSGGIFSEDVSAYCADGYVCKQNTDGTYGIKAEREAWILRNGMLKYYGTLAEAVADAKDGETIILAANVELSERINIDKDITIGDYGSLTLSIVGNGGINVIGDANVALDTFNIDISGAVAKGDCIIGVGNYSNNGKLTLNNVNVTGNGYSSAYAVFYVYNTSELNINGGNITLSNDKASAGGFIKAEQGKDGIVNITDATVALTDAKIGFLDGTVKLDGVELNIKGGANAINQSALTVIDSTVTIDGADGRALTLSQGDVTVVNSTLNFSNCAEGEIRFKKGLTLSIDENSTINDCNVYADASAVDVANVNGEVITGVEANMSAIEGGHVVNPAWVAKVGNVYYMTLEEAIAAGGEVTLLVDVALDKTVKVKGNVVLNLNGKNIVGTDNATGNFALIEIQPDADLTINGEGTITLTAANDRDFNAYSSVISNQRGKLTVNGGVIEHLGGTDMAYGIDNLTNGKGTYAETIINGGTVKSTYRAIRQFLNGTEAQNILTVNGGTVEGANKAIWAQDTNTYANSGAITISENATVNGTVYLTVSKGSAEWDLEVSIPATADVVTTNVPAGYELIVVDGSYTLKHGVAKIGNEYYATLAEALAAVQAGETIQLLPVTLTEGTIKLPSPLTNVTIKGAEGAVLKNTTIMAADGNSISYEGLTFDGITFENSRISITGWRTGGASVKDLTVTNCVFKNLDDTSNSAPVHINMAAEEAVENFTFTNNVIDGATGGSKSGVYAQATGNVTFTGNTINNVAFRPYVIQITTDDGIADNFVVTGNTFSGSAAGRAQGLGNNAAGTDNVNLVVSGNIFKGITNTYQICYWNFNEETTTADLSKNYYDIDILANPSKIYYNTAAKNADDLLDMGIYPYYADEAMTQLVNAPAIMVSYADGTVEYFDDMLKAVPYTTNYPKLEGATITLLADVSGAGLRFMENDMVFDLNGHVYTITAGTGSQGTNTSGFQIRPEVTTKVTFKNGTINVDENVPVVWMFNVYAADFIVEDVTIWCTNMAWSYGEDCYVAVSRSGDNIQFTGSTNVNGFNAEVAGNAYSIGGTMTMGDDVVPGGIIELDPGASLTAREGLEVVTAEGYGVVYNNGVYSVVKYVAAIGNEVYTSLAEALADVQTGDNTITLLADIDEDVIIEQVEGINITIDGDNHVYTGTMEIYGHARYNDEETLTIQNVKFETSEAKHDFITCNTTESVKRYAHNVTVENCSFTATGDAVNSAVGLRLRQCYDILVKNSTATGLHSLIQATGGNTMVIDTVTVDGCKNGIAAGTTDGVTVKNSTINVTGYGVRADGNAASDMTVSGNTITAAQPVVVRRTTAAYDLTVTGNTLNAPEGAYQVVITEGEDDAAYVNPTGAFALESDVDTNKVYPAAAYAAQVGDYSYTSVEAALEAAENDDTVIILKDLTVENTIVVTKSVTIDLNGQTLTGKDVYPVIRVQNNAYVTIDNGVITNDDYVFVLGASDGSSYGYLTILGGNYHGETTVASVTKGELVVEGGYFSVKSYDGEGYQNFNYLLNCVDANYAYGDANIVVKGGSFENFNPADNAAEGLGTNFVDPLYESSTSNGVVWNVNAYGAGEIPENPIDLTADLVYEGDFSATVTVPAGKTHYFMAYGIGGMLMSINGGEDTVCAGNPRMPYAWNITNDGAEAAEYVITVAFPAGSWNNPAELVIGENTASVEAGAQGYFYNWTASEDGTLIITMPWSDWTYTINNMTAGAYGDTQWSDSDPVVNPAYVKVVAGDEIQVIVNSYDPTNPWGNPAADITFTAEFNNANNPAAIEWYWNEEGTEAWAYVDIPAGITMYYSAYVSGMELDINGELYGTLNGSRWMPAVFSVANTTDEAASYELHLTYPVGSRSNPAELVIGDNTASIEAGNNQGYWFNWTAPAAGMLTITMPEGDWMYVINNMTTYQYGDTQWSDSDPVVNPAVLHVAEGDELQIMVNSYDPANMWSNPAAELVINAAFAGDEQNPIMVEWIWNDEYTEATATVEVGANATYYYSAYVSGMELTINGESAGMLNGNRWMPATFTVTNDGDAVATFELKISYPIGSQNNPAELVIGDNTAAIEAGNDQGYWFTWTAAEDGVLVITMPEGDWMYVINNMTTYTYGDTQWSDSDPVVNPAYVNVAAGDEIQIMVSTYDPNAWEAPAGTVVFDADFWVPVAQNKETGKVYGTVADAMAEAKSGETVILTADVTEDMLYVRVGRTLDLNGHTLTVNDVVAVNSANIVDNSTANTGLLVVDQNSVMISKENTQLPVWNGNGYVFTTVDLTRARIENVTEDSFLFAFQPRMLEAAKALLADGANDNDVTIEARVSWETEMGREYRNLVFNETQIGKVIPSANGAFLLTFSGFQGLNIEGEILVEAVVYSGTGVVYASTGLPVNVG